MIIKDRTFVISGGASGLGYAAAQELHNHGGSVAILDMNEEGGQAFVKELGQDRARFFEVDVTETDSIAQAVQGVVSWTKETGRQIGGVVAAAGVANPGRIINRHGEPLSMEAFDFVVNLNLRGVIDLVRQLLPTIIKNEPLKDADDERGVLIFVASVAAFEGQIGQVAYAASKGALVSLTLPMTRDLAPFGVRVVSIAPGLFETAMASNISEKTKKSLAGAMEHPKRFGRASEFGRMCKEVVENRMMNGSVIRLDGGIRPPSKM